MWKYDIYSTFRANVLLLSFRSVNEKMSFFKMCPERVDHLQTPQIFQKPSEYRIIFRKYSMPEKLFN